MALTQRYGVYFDGDLNEIIMDNASKTVMKPSYF